MDINFKKAWRFIWHDDSPLSWLISIVLAFIIVKFILYPGIGFLLGTTHPIVAVVSYSMDHSVVEGNNGVPKLCGTIFPKEESMNFDEYWNVCGEWYESSGITKTQFSKFNLKNGFKQGDIMFAIGKKAKDINKGDVLIFQSTTNYPIIHRVVDVWQSEGEYHFKTKGDHNSNSYSELKETDISEDKIVGVAMFRVPYLGWIKIMFTRLVGGII